MELFIFIIKIYTFKKIVLAKRILITSRKKFPSNLTAIEIVKIDIFHKKFNVITINIITRYLLLINNSLLSSINFNSNSNS